MWLVPPAQASTEPTTLTLTFEGGLPTKIDGETLALPDLIAKLNEIAGQNGIGKIDIFEDGIMDLKSREIYEAPGAKVILAVHKDIEAATLTKQQLVFKKHVDAQWASLVYHGEWFQPLKSNLDAFIASTQAVVSGDWTISLYKGNIEIIKRQSHAMLFRPEIRSIDATGFNQQICGPAAFIRGLPFQVIAARDAELAEQVG